MVPDVLRSRTQWLVWRFESKQGQKKPAKMPYYAGGARRVGKQGDDADRQALTTFDLAMEAKSLGQYDGVGFAFLPGDGLIGIDLDSVIDERTGQISARAASMIEACSSFTEYSPSRRGVHIYVLGETESFKSNDAGVEVFCGRQFFTVTGEHYPGTPELVNAIGDKTLRRLRATVDQAKGKRRRPAPRPVPSDQRSKVESALAVISADCGYDEWIEIGMAIQAELGEAGFGVWDYWSSRGSKYPGPRGANGTETHWKSFKPGGGITGATLFKRAKDAGWQQAKSVQTSAPIVETEGEQLPPRYSEEAQAAEWIRRHSEFWRFDAERSRWRFYDRGRWLEDLTLRAFDQARAVARDRAAAATTDPELSSIAQARVATAIASARNVAAIITLARADRKVAVSSDCWDQDRWLLNTVSGVLDVRNGRMLEHSPGYMMTKICGTAPRGECPLWLAFLDRITGGDRELVAFLQRFTGYCLTGETKEHVLLFLWGLGSNGKSTFCTAIMGALGDYGTTAPSETFVESYAERHPTDLAMLRGARLVVVQEVEDGQRWAASKIKQLTGGDRIRARFMRQDYFEYLPQFKLIFCGNHKPAFRHVDEAIRRRFYLVPFTQTIAPSERDLALPEKLRGELSGILLWMLDGCLQWQRIGLAPPEKVRQATAAYLEDEDMLRTWMLECCEEEARAFSPVAELYRSYQGWAQRAGERFPFGMKRFSQMLEDHGYGRDRAATTRVRGFSGLRLKHAQERLDAIG